MSDHEPISIPSVRRKIGYKKGWRSLLNYLRAKEIACGVRFIARTKWGDGRTGYLVTLAAVRFYAPEISGGEKLGPEQADGVQKMREHLSLLDEKIAEETAEQVVKLVSPRIRALSNRVLSLENKAKAGAL